MLVADGAVSDQEERYGQQTGKEEKKSVISSVSRKHD
jgi:hypothetical protein